MTIGLNIGLREGFIYDKPRFERGGVLFWVRRPSKLLHAKPCLVCTTQFISLFELENLSQDENTAEPQNLQAYQNIRMQINSNGYWSGYF